MMKHIPVNLWELLGSRGYPPALPTLLKGRFCAFFFNIGKILSGSALLTWITQQALANLDKT
jgi:hypothetical protein